MLAAVSDMIDTKKRVFLSLIILGIAYMVTINTAVAKDYAMLWIGMAVTIVGSYFGSHTTAQAMAAKSKSGEDQGGDGTGGST